MVSLYDFAERLAKLSKNLKICDCEPLAISISDYQQILSLYELNDMSTRDR